jgi:hypothetical protein
VVPERPFIRHGARIEKPGARMVREMERLPDAVRLSEAAIRRLDERWLP